MKSFSRRRFLQASGACGALALERVPAIRLRPRRETLGVAVIGVRSRGKNLVDSLRNLPEARLLAVCDVDQAVLEGEVARLAQAGLTVEGVRDARALFQRSDIDAVAIATPNHWHALMAIWAIEAGKDVYVEKPVSHSLWEGRQIVRAARKHGRIVQTGTQCRSSSGIRAGVDWIQAGGLGAIRLARGLCYKPRQSIGRVEAPSAVSPRIDYDLWTGPAPLRPLWRASLHYDWHWDLATGNGDLGNQGIHQMDLARWALGEQGLPPATLSIGGRLGYVDDGNTPNTQIVCHAYAKAPLIFEVRGLPRNRAAQTANWGGSMDQFHGASIGVVVHCEGGVLVIPDYSQAIAYDKEGKELRRFQGAEDHMANFLAAVRSRRPEDLAADIEQGHVSSALCHLGLLSHQLGEQRELAAIASTLSAQPDALESFQRMSAHLAANGVDCERSGLVLGRALRLDPGTERIEGGAEVQALAHGTQRAPYRWEEYA